MKPKTRAQIGPAELVAAVAGGEAELGVFLRNVLIDPRLEVIDPFPAALQQEIVVTAAVAADGAEPDAARAFIAYLRGAEGRAVFESRGMTPG